MSIVASANHALHSRILAELRDGIERVKVLNLG